MRVRCNNYKTCSSIHCKHKHKHFRGKDCLEECDEPGYAECEEQHIATKNSGSALRKNKTILYNYVSDLDTKYTFPWRG